MLKLTKAIVDGNHSLIGFVVKGKERELGGLSENMVERSVPLSTIISDKFSNNQISVVKGKIIEKGSFRLNQLHMTVYVNNSYVDIDNSVALVQRFVQNNENIGFRVRFADGSEDNLRYANVLMLCKWFKPVNFSIRTSSKNRQYICGKKGGPNIDQLPAVQLGKAPEVKPKRTKSAAKDKKELFNGAIESGFDILDVYGFIKDCNGCIIKLPDEKYEAASEGGEKKLDSFTSLGIGEVASVDLQFNPTKLNVNAKFKKVGIVPVTINGTVQNITTFVYRNKSIFLRGENYIKKFGIAVPTDKEEELIKFLGKSLALEKITDSTITAPLGQVIDAKSLAFYKVDSSKIDLISEKKRAESILTGNQLVELCKKQYEMKLISKALGPRAGLMKTLKDALGDSFVADVKGKKPFGIFSMMNNDALNALREAGIDIYNGSYTVPGTPYVKPGAGKKDEDSDSVEIEYILKGYDAGKITGSKVLDAAKANDTTKLTPFVINVVNEVLKAGDFQKQFVAASEAYEAAERTLNNINKTLWMHTSSMYLIGNKKKIHNKDSKNWIPDASSKVKTARVFECTAAGCEGLTVKFSGVDI